MIQDVYGIKDFQAQLPKISRHIGTVGGHYLVTRHNKPVFVTVPFEDYKVIEDVLLEYNSPALQRTIREGREEYRRGKTVKLDELQY